MARKEKMEENKEKRKKKKSKRNMNKRFKLRAKELEVKSRRRRNSSTYMEKNKIRIHMSKNYRTTIDKFRHKMFDMEQINLLLQKTSPVKGSIYIKGSTIGSLWCEWPELQRLHKSLYRSAQKIKIPNLITPMGGLNGL